MIERVLRKKKALSAILAVGVYFFVGNADIVLGNSTQEGIGPKGAFLLNPKTTFEHFCAPCHGETGAGDGIYYPSDLSPRPRDFTDADFMQSRTDEQLFTAISEGSAAVGRSNRCPPWGHTISREKINEIIAYLRSLASNSVERPAGEVVPPPEQGNTDTDKKSSALVQEWVVLGGLMTLLILIAIYQWRKKFLGHL